MGTPLIDCKNVATLIGIKTFTNEFIAYEQLATLIKNRGIIETWESSGNQSAVYNSINNCYTLSNSTWTASDSECLQKISVSPHNYVFLTVFPLVFLFFLSLGHFHKMLTNSRKWLNAFGITSDGNLYILSSRLPCVFMQIE